MRLALLFVGLLLALAPRIQAQSIPYSALSHCQDQKFQTLHTGIVSSGPQTWLALDDSQRLEYAGGSQALTTTAIPPPPCKGLDQSRSLNAIWGARPNQSSADQFHIELDWIPKASDVFKSLPGWHKHISWLHPHQYGFGENRGGNPFLGLVVLFDKNDPGVGQFHIGFRSLFSHYFANNGNIEKNYKRYCKWYGSINGYAPCQSSQMAIDWRNQANPAGEAAGPSADISKTVRQFLSEWYVQQGLDGLNRFIAKDNVPNWLSEFGVLPHSVTQSFWSALFSEAFEEGAGSVRFESLSNAIAYQAPDLPLPLKYSNNPVEDHFAIIDPGSIDETGLLPTDDFPADQMDPSAKFLRHLKQEYRAEDSKSKLAVVVYTTIGPGLLHEGAVLYWIQEDGVWKLAAFQGTD